MTYSSRSARRSITAAIPKMEEKKGQEQTLRQLSAVATPEAFAAKIANRPNSSGDVLLITGVGEVYQFMSVHNILDKINNMF